MSAGSPFDVHPKQRACAWAIALVLFGIYLVFCVFAIVVKFQERENPPTSMTFEVQSGIAPPLLYICPPNQRTGVDFFNKTNIGSCSGAGCTILPRSIKNKDGPLDCVEINPGTFVFASEEDRLMLKINGLQLSPDYFFPPTSAPAYLLEMRIFTSEVSDTFGRDVSASVSVPSDKFSSVQLSARKVIDIGGAVSYDWIISSVTPFEENQPSQSREPVDPTLVIRISTMTIAVLEEQDPLQPTEVLGTMAGFVTYVTLIWRMLFTVAPEDRRKLIQFTFWWSPVSNDEADDELANKPGVEMA